MNAIGRLVVCVGAVGLVASCSLTLDLDDLAKPGPSTLDGGSSTSIAVGGGARDAGGEALGSGRSDGDAGPCERFRVRLSGCAGGKATYFPAGGTADRGSSPELIAIGQYEPRNGVSTRVVDNRTSPHVLVLSSYEDTVWQVVAKAPSAVTVLLSGYEDSRVEGVAGAPNEPGSPQADEYPSRAADELFDYAMGKTGATAVTAFGGCYELTEATIEDACP